MNCLMNIMTRMSGQVKKTITKKTKNVNQRNTRQKKPQMNGN